MTLEQRRILRTWSMFSVLLAVLLLCGRAGEVGFTGAIAAQQEGGGARPNPLMPPDRELAMKVKGSFTFAGVGDIIIRHPVGQLAAPAFQNLVKYLREADASFGNMEGTIIEYDTFPYRIGLGQPKSLLADLKNMGIRMVSTANNHSMDSGEMGVFETIRLLNSAEIMFAGTGGNLQAARAPGYLNTPKGVVGLVGVFSLSYPEFQPRFVPDLEDSPMPGRYLNSFATYQNGNRGGNPGLNPLPVVPIYSVTPEELAALRKTRDAIYAHRDKVPGAVPPVPADEPKDLLYSFGQWYKAGGKPGEITYHMNEEHLNEILRSIRVGKQYSDFMVVSIHCHQNNYIYQQYGFDHEVPDFLVEFAHKAIDSGADLFIGHGVHTLRPVEIYKGKPIFYGVNEFLWQLPQSSLPQNPGGHATDAEVTFRPGSEQARLNFEEALEGLLVQARFEDGRLVEARLHPADLGRDLKRPFSQRGIPLIPSPEAANAILQKMQKLSQPFGTTITIENGVGVIRPKT